ncbi:MAG: peptidylprolyl isomerase [Limisphaerales bacterium]
MKNNTKLIISVALGAALLTAGAAHAETAGVSMPTNQAPASDAASMAGATNNPEAAMASLFEDPVIVKGKGFVIKQSELDEMVSEEKAAAAARGMTLSDDQLSRFEGDALNSIINRNLLTQKANDADRAQAVKEADEAVADLVKRNGREAVDMQLKASGRTLDEERSNLVTELTASDALIREVGVTVSDADIKSYYDDHPTDFEQPEQVKARHILFATVDLTSPAQTPLSDDQKAAKLKQAQDVLKQLRAGGDFAKLAQQYSDDPGSKVNGGELPAFTHGEMVPEFDTAAFALTNNQISDIVTSQYGYHIIQLISKTPAHKIQLAEVSDRIKAFLTRQKLQPIAPAYLLKLKSSSGVQILDTNLQAAVAAADAAAAAAATATNQPPASAQ